MSTKNKNKLIANIMMLTNAAMLAGEITGVEIVEALEFNVKTAKNANEKIMEIAPNDNAAIEVVYGETKGQA